MRKGAATNTHSNHAQDADVIVDGNGQNISGFHQMGGFCDLGAVQANVACFYEFGGHGAMFHDAGKPEPFVEALRQFFLPII